MGLLALALASWVFSSILSPTASLAAEALFPMLVVALELKRSLSNLGPSYRVVTGLLLSLATFLLVSLETPEVAPWTVSLTYSVAFLAASIVIVV